jgi:hypothetical protein
MLLHSSNNPQVDMLLHSNNPQVDMLLHSSNKPQVDMLLHSNNPDIYSLPGISLVNLVYLSRLSNPSKSGFHDIGYLISTQY